MTRLVESVRRVIDRASVLPFLVRCAIVVCGVAALFTAWPSQFTVSRYSAGFVAVALYPAISPRGRAGTIAALFVVAGWLVDTVGFDSRVALWRVLTIATALYLGHTLTALAAVLPYDAEVNLDVVGGWLARALVVVLISAVLTVISLGLASDLAGPAFLAATLAGLACAAGATILLARLIRRPEM
jgi:hypothetical protein